MSYDWLRPSFFILAEDVDNARSCSGEFYDAYDDEDEIDSSARLDDYTTYEDEDDFGESRSSMDPFGWGDFDRECINESDGMHFWGSDNEDGTTDWYTDCGDLDSTTITPDDDEFW